MGETKRQYYSQPYHRYWQDYSERKVCDQNGNIRIERVYVGKYYRPVFTAKELLKRKLGYTLLYLLGISLFIWCNTRPLVCMVSLPVGVGQCLSTLSLLWLLVELIAFWLQPEKLEEKHFRDTVTYFKRACLFSAGCLFATAIAIAWFLLYFNGFEFERSLECLVGYVVSAGVVLSIYCIHKRVRYLVLPGRNERPPESSMIEY